MQIPCCTVHSLTLSSLTSVPNVSASCSFAVDHVSLLPSSRFPHCLNCLKASHICLRPVI